MKFRQLSPHDEEKLQLRMAPMIDMIFLILIFFMCTARWKQAEGNLAAELPSQDAPKMDAPPPDVERVIIKLQRTPAGVEIRMNDNPCPDFDALYQNLQAIRQHVDVPVIIDAQRTVPFQAAITAVNLAVKADLPNVSFAAPITPVPGE